MRRLHPYLQTSIPSKPLRMRVMEFGYAWTDFDLMLSRIYRFGVDPGR